MGLTEYDHNKSIHERDLERQESRGNEVSEGENSIGKVEAETVQLDKLETTTVV